MLDGRFRMICDPVDDNIRVHLLNEGIWEPPSSEKVDQEFTGGIFVDCGAHWGYYSLLASRAAEHVYAFEANPETYRYLALNVILNQLESKITAYPLALWSEPMRISSIKVQGNTGGTGISADGIGPIEAVTLDSVIEKADFIKIDCEGSDKEILKGATRILKGHPKILVERPDGFFEGSDYKLVWNTSNLGQGHLDLYA